MRLSPVTRCLVEKFSFYSRARPFKPNRTFRGPTEYRHGRRCKYSRSATMAVTARAVRRNDRIVYLRSRASEFGALTFGKCRVSHGRCALPRVSCVFPARLGIGGCDGRGSCTGRPTSGMAASSARGEYNRQLS